MNVQFFALIAVFFVSLSVGAENSFIAGAYNQISQGRFCGSVTKQDLKDAKFTCGFGQPLEKIDIPAWQIFEWNVHQLAAQNQIDKNKCLSEQIDFLKSDPKTFNIWSSQLTAAWLGMKKAQLIVHKCESQVLNRMEPVNVKRYGKLKAYEMSLKNQLFQQQEPLDKDFLEMCFDSKKMDARKAAINLFSYSLPVISQSEFFDIMENHRGNIIDKKTGKPLTNEALMNLDLRDLSQIRLTKSKSFKDSIYKSLDGVIKDRTLANKKFLDAKASFGFKLNTELRDYIYEDGTLHQTLVAHNHIKPDYNGLDNSRQNGVSNGAFCLLAKHEPTMVGTTVDILATTMFGGVIFKALLKARKFSHLTPAQRSTKSMQYGAYATSALMIAEQAKKSCPIPIIGETYRTSKIVESSKGEAEALNKSANVPEDLGFEMRQDLDIDPAKTPSCRNIEDKNFMINSLYSKNCFLDVLLSF